VYFVGKHRPLFPLPAREKRSELPSVKSNCSVRHSSKRDRQSASRGRVAARGCNLTCSGYCTRAMESNVRSAPEWSAFSKTRCLARAERQSTTNQRQ